MKYDFREEAKKVHGDKYDYSLVKYLNGNTKVKIICKIHGIFEQRPSNHTYRKQGCPLCSKRKKYAINEIIEEAKKVHGCKYNYEKSVYINKNTKIKIYCNSCNENFFQTPYSHINNKQGCPSCHGNKKMNTIEFIKKAKKIHGDKYNYEKALYTNSNKNINIFCNSCNKYFYQLPNNHLSKNCNCSHCSSNKKKTKEKFIEEAKKIHGDKYDYSLVEYFNRNTKVKIICKTHGIFEQRPSNHITNSSGCRLCGIKRIRKKTIKRIEENNLNGNQLIPNFNKFACNLFDKISEKKHIHIQHAMNGGEFYIKKLGYWVDGYDKENNVVYEYDELKHFNKNGKLKKKDKTRQQEIVNYLKCKFIRIKDN